MGNRQYAGVERAKQRDQAAEMYIVHGTSISDISIQMEIPEPTLRLWMKMQNWMERRKEQRNFAQIWPEQLRTYAEKTIKMATEALEALKVGEKPANWVIVAPYRADTALYRYREKVHIVDEAEVSIRVITKLVAYLRKEAPDALQQLSPHLTEFSKRVKRDADQ